MRFIASIMWVVDYETVIKLRCFKQKKLYFIWYAVLGTFYCYYCI